MKKFLRIMLCLCLFAGILTGCEGKKESVSESRKEERQTEECKEESINESTEPEVFNPETIQTQKNSLPENELLEIFIKYEEYIHKNYWENGYLINEYCLAYIDEDDIPELLVRPVKADGSQGGIPSCIDFLSYINGGVVENRYSSGRFIGRKGEGEDFLYIEKEGILTITSGLYITSMRTERINFSNGMLESSLVARCCFDEGSQYYVGESEASEEEYDEAVKNAIDRTRSKKIEFYGGMAEAYRALSNTDKGAFNQG